MHHVVEGMYTIDIREMPRTIAGTEAPLCPRAPKWILELPRYLHTQLRIVLSQPHTSILVAGAYHARTYMYPSTNTTMGGTYLSHCKYAVARG